MIKVSFGQTLQDDATIELVSLTGQILQTRYIGKVTEGQVESISTNDLAPSVYLLKVTINNEQKVTKLSIH